MGKISKGHYSVKSVGGVTFLVLCTSSRFFFSAHRLMMVYICTKFRENILDGMKVIERTRFS